MIGLAAADGEQPEEPSGESKSGGDPYGGEKPGIELSTYTIEPSGALDGADDNHRCRRCKSGESANGDGSDGSDDERHTREGAAAVGKNAKQQGDSQRHKRYDQDDLRPAGDIGKGVHGIGDCLGNGDVFARERDKGIDVSSRLVEESMGPVEGRFGTIARAITGSVAVAPDTDIVEVKKAEISGGDVTRSRFAARSAGAGHRLQCIRNNAFNVVESLSWA